MSEYLTFFVRHLDENHFIELGSFSRSHELFQVFETAPYEKIMTLSIREIDCARDKLKETIEEYNEEIEKYNKRIKFVLKTKASLNEKLDYFDEYKIRIEELKTDIDNIINAISFLTFIKGIHYDNEVNENDVCLYVGKEIINPTFDDIVIP